MYLDRRVAYFSSRDYRFYIDWFDWVLLIALDCIRNTVHATHLLSAVAVVDDDDTAAYTNHVDWRQAMPVHWRCGCCCYQWRSRRWDDLMTDRQRDIIGSWDQHTSVTVKSHSRVYVTATITTWTHNHKSQTLLTRLTLSIRTVDFGIK